MMIKHDGKLSKRAVVSARLWFGVDTKPKIKCFTVIGFRTQSMAYLILHTKKENSSADFKVTLQSNE